jgi:hypothetical protein
VKVFLSYRRDDTGGRAGRLFDIFVSRFGGRNVFQDVNTVAPGLDFPSQVEAAIKASDVVLVVIGPQWRGAVDRDGIQRIDQPDDFVRREVSTALAAGARVVPVLVDGAALPPAEELPDDLASLVLRQAVTLHDVSWHTDVDDLVRRLQDEERFAAHPRRRPRLLAAVVAGLLVVLVIVAVVIIRLHDDDSSSGRGTTGTVADTSPISLPAILPFAATSQKMLVCRPEGHVTMSAGPVERQGDIIETRFTASAGGLNAPTVFDAIRVTDEQGRQYDGVEGRGAFSLKQDTTGETEYSVELRVNRDVQGHGTAGIVIVVTGDCNKEPFYLPLSMPGD